MTLVRICKFRYFFALQSSRSSCGGCGNRLGQANETPFCLGAQSLRSPTAISGMIHRLQFEQWVPVAILRAGLRRQETLEKLLGYKNRSTLAGPDGSKD